MGEIITRKDFLKGAAAASLALPASDAGASLGGGTGRSRGLLGGCFTGCMMASQQRGDPLSGTCAWVVDIPAVDGTQNIVRISSMVGTFPAVIDWGDGTTTRITSSTTTLHTYNSVGEYTIRSASLTVMRSYQVDTPTYKNRLQRVYLGGNGQLVLSSFWLNPQLVSVDFGNTTITGVDLRTFRSCISLASIGDISNCGYINNEAFMDCSALSMSVSIPLCTRIGENAFRNSGIISLGNLNVCSSIGNSAFQGCTSLVSVGSLSACTSMGNGAFKGCTSLVSVGDLSACTSLGNNTFSGCTLLVSVGDMTSCTSIGNSMFNGCTSLTSIGDLPACTSIGEQAFRSCSLTSIGDMPLCRTIYNQAFILCSRLQSIGDMPSLVTIAAYAFYSCTSLTSVGDMSSCTTIGSDVFRDCRALVSIGDLSALTSVGSSSFSNTNSLTSLTFSSRTHTEVEGITGFANFPQRRTCVFHCADGDYYSNGTSLLPVS